ncbi:MAG: hypothetical protein LBV72_06065 [Tannerella sp.]|jgi:hypothetical protein|nr:hypothetical protein [Tannerella sp.]
MTKENPKIKSVLRSLFQVSIDKLVREDPSSAISNLYVQLDAEAGEVLLYDERERLLHKKVIFDWIGAGRKDHNFISKALSILRSVIEMLVAEGVFNHPLFIRPFSIRLADEEFKGLADVYTMVDDDPSSDDDLLMKDLDEELDVFLKKLLSDVK